MYLKQKRSQSIHLMLLGTATLLSGCHSTPFVPDQADLYQSPDRDPNMPPGAYATEADCMNAVGAGNCEPVGYDVASRPTVTPFGESGPTDVAVGYTDDEYYPLYYVPPYPFSQQLIYWFGRGGGARVAPPIVRGGFGRSSARYGGVWA